LAFLHGLLLLLQNSSSELLGDFSFFLSPSFFFRRCVPFFGPAYWFSVSIFLLFSLLKSLLFFRVVVDGVAIFNFGGAIKLRQPPARKRDKGRGTAEQNPITQAGEERRVSPLSSAESDLTFL
jgi:hypothetical protein